MKIKLLDFTITADVSEEQVFNFKKELKEKYEVRESQLIDTIELLDYMLENIEYKSKGGYPSDRQDSFVLSIYNVSTKKDNLPNSKIHFIFNINEQSAGINIESWRLDNN